MVWLNMIQFAINIFVRIWNMFVPADFLTNFTALVTLAGQRLPQLRLYLGYVSYFIPLTYLITPLFLMVSLFFVRIFFALFHFFTNLWGNLKLL